MGRDVLTPEVSISTMLEYLSNLIGGIENSGWMNAMKAFDHSRPAFQLML